MQFVVVTTEVGEVTLAILESDAYLTMAASVPEVASSHHCYGNSYPLSHSSLLKDDITYK